MSEMGAWTPIRPAFAVYPILPNGHSLAGSTFMNSRSTTVAYDPRGS